MSRLIPFSDWLSRIFQTLSTVFFLGVDVSVRACVWDVSKASVVVSRGWWCVIVRKTEQLIWNFVAGEQLSERNRTKWKSKTFVSDSKTFVRKLQERISFQMFAIPSNWWWTLENKVAFKYVGRHIHCKINDTFARGNRERVRNGWFEILKRFLARATISFASSDRGLH